MGDQACILYGGAEFSRDVDFAVAVSADNLRRLRAALKDLGARAIFFPPLSAAALRRGHACHFRCADGLRVDVMARMRGAPPLLEALGAAAGDCDPRHRRRARGLPRRPGPDQEDPARQGLAHAPASRRSGRRAARLARDSGPYPLLAQGGRDDAPPPGAGPEIPPGRRASRAPPPRRPRRAPRLAIGRRARAPERRTGRAGEGPAVLGAAAARARTVAARTSGGPRASARVGRAPARVIPALAMVRRGALRAAGDPAPERRRADRAAAAGRRKPKPSG